MMSLVVLEQPNTFFLAVFEQLFIELCLDDNLSCV